jgi:hypothetical protein
VKRRAVGHDAGLPRPLWARRVNTRFALRARGGGERSRRGRASEYEVNFGGHDEVVLM